MVEADRRWTTEDLSNYINQFDNSEARENIIRELVSSKILKTCLDSVEGKLVLGSVIDSVRDNMMKIVRYSIEGFDKNQEAIRQAALQINVSYDFMYGIANTLNRGESHETEMKKGSGV